MSLTPCFNGVIRVGERNQTKLMRRKFIWLMDPWDSLRILKMVIQKHHESSAALVPIMDSLSDWNVAILPFFATSGKDVVAKVKALSLQDHLITFPLSLYYYTTQLNTGTLTRIPQIRILVCFDDEDTSGIIKGPHQVRNGLRDLWVTQHVRLSLSNDSRQNLPPAPPDCHGIQT